jgi:D-aminoacyl-tRNA deacylase
MLKLMVYSEDDAAGRNIASHLREKIPFAPIKFGAMDAMAFEDLCLVGVKGSLVGLDIPLPGVEWLLCLSRHRSTSGTRCLTAHSPGNLTGSAQLGGSPNEVAISNPPLQSSLICELQRSKAELGFDCPITLEATHHGPTDLPCPVTFVEIGSDEDAWGNDLLGKATALAVFRSVTGPQPSARCALGVGGGHYPEKFTNLVLDKSYSLGHIIPKYALADGMEERMLRRCVERTAGECSAIIVDWKGTPSAFKEQVRSLSKALGLELVKV